MMTSAQVVETSVNVTSNSPSQDYTHPDDHNLPSYLYTVMITILFGGKLGLFLGGSFYPSNTLDRTVIGDGRGR